MSSQNENNNDGLIVGVGILALVLGVWWLFGKQLTVIYLYWKYIEYLMIEYTGMSLIFSESWAVRVTPVLGIFDMPLRDITVEHLRKLGAGIGYFSRWYFLVIFMGIGYKILEKNPLAKFRRVFDMMSLVASEKRLWPAITPVAKLNLIEESVEKGPWSMSKNPKDFSRYYKLLDDGNKLNRDRGEKLFSAQLGKLWDGYSRLPPYTKALFAIFAAQANGDLVAAKNGLDILSRTVSEGKPDYSFVNPLLKKYGDSDIVKNVCNSHAYIYTVMASLLESAREFGVLASAQFVWLRPLNRPLWYTLNGVGRRVAFAEIAGIYAHWIAEKVAGHAIEKPYVIKAVDGLERALLEIKFD